MKGFIDQARSWLTTGTETETETETQTEQQQ